MSIHQDNLQAVLGQRGQKTLKNASIDLGIYHKQLQRVRGQLQQLRVLAVELRRVKTHTSAAGGAFQYEILDSNEHLPEIEQRLFDKEVRQLYSHRLHQRGETARDRIKILNRDAEEGQVELGQDQGETCTLYIREDDYQLKMQLQALQRLRNQPLREHAPLLKLFCSGRHERLDGVDFDEAAILNETANWAVLTDATRNGTSEQRDFVRKSLASADFALLEGPPGSGKTTTIVELIVQLCRLNKRVLLVSSTHVAVDNVLKRILTSYRDKCDPEVVPVRIANDAGQIRYEEVQRYRLQQLEQQKRREMIRHLEVQAQRSMSQETLLNSLKSGRESHLLRDLILESANLVGGTMIGILQHPLIKNATDEVPFDVMIVDEASKVPFTQFLVPALYAKKWVLVGDVKQLSPYVEGEHVELMLREQLSDEHIRQALCDLFPVLRALARKAANRAVHILLSEAVDAGDIRQLIPPQYAVFHLRPDSFLPERDTWALNAADLVVGADRPAVHRLLAQHLYVLAQVHSTSDPAPLRRTQHYFSADYWNRPSPDSAWEKELAQRLDQRYAFRDAPELGAHIERDVALLLPTQLTEVREGVADIIRTTMPSILELLQNGIARPADKDYLERILYDGFPARAKQLKFVSLSYQHRMQDAIAKTSRSQFYASNLRTANTVTERANFLHGYRGDSAVLWRSNNYRAPYIRSGHRSNANPEEADHIMEEIRHFLRWTTTQPRREAEIAVLCFYLDQVREMRQRLRRLYRKNGQRGNPTKNFRFDDVKITLCSVDKFQGDEADLVLLSFSKASKGAFYKSPNRLNVALTRARYKLILFGNRRFFERRNVSAALTGLATDFPELYALNTANQ